MGPDDFQQRLVLVLGFLHGKEQIFPVEAGHDPARVVKAEQMDDVVADFGRCGCREGTDHRPGWQFGQEILDFHIAGPEIIAPLGDAMCLVYGQHGHGQLLAECEKGRGQQPFRCNIDQLIVLAGCAPDHFRNLG